MVERLPLPVLLVTLLMAGLFAGCVGGDDPKPAAGDKTETPTGATGPTTPTGPVPGGGAAVKEPDESGCAFEFCLEGHVYAPVWQQGLAWTYKVTGSLFPSEYDMTVGVFQVAEDHYKLGTDSQDELNNAVTYDSLLVTNVQKDSYAVLKKGEYRDILGFRQIGGSAWTIEGNPFYYNPTWDLNKSASREITWAGGKGLGFRIEGVGSRGQFLNIEYASDAKWITLLEYLDTDGTPFVRYELQQAHRGFDVATLKQWEFGWWKSTGPIGNVPVNAQNWQSSGQGKVLMRLVTAPGMTAEGRLVSGSNVYDLSHKSAAARQDSFRIENDAVGGWQSVILIARDGGVGIQTSILYAIQVFERTAGGEG